MVKLTTTASEAIDFDPAAVTAVSDRDADTGEAVTCVFGLAVGVLRTQEPVPALLERLHLAAAFARHAPGRRLHLVRGQGGGFGACAVEGEYVSSVRAVVSAGALTQGVTQTPEEVRRLVDAHGGAL